MSDMLVKYYQGITQQLRAEVDFINSLFEHEGLKGEGNENALRDLIIKFLPKKYSVGRGILVDHKGNFSKQCDIVIYDDTQFSPLLSLTSVHIYPVDIVYAVIEVKTTLDKTKANLALENIKSVRKLECLQPDVPTPKIPFLNDEGKVINVDLGVETAPIGVVFAYDSTTPVLQTFKSWFIPENEPVKPYYPSIVTCLDQGSVMYVQPFLEWFADKTLDYKISDDDKEAIFQVFPVWKKDTNSPVEVTTESRFHPHEGILYPVKNSKTHNSKLLIDQSLTLLFFLLQIQDWLSWKRLFPDINFRDTYVPAKYKRVLRL